MRPYFIEMGLRLSAFLWIAIAAFKHVPLVEAVGVFALLMIAGGLYCCAHTYDVWRKHDQEQAMRERGSR